MFLRRNVSPGESIFTLAQTGTFLSGSLCLSLVSPMSAELVQPSSPADTLYYLRNIYDEKLSRGTREEWKKEEEEGYLNVAAFSFLSYGHYFSDWWHTVLEGEMWREGEKHFDHKLPPS